jgi:hypothetical protein
MAGFRRFVNPENGSTITGESGDQIGRGGNKSLYVVDEAMFLANADAAEGALAETTNLRIDVSTPNEALGASGPYYERRMSGEVPVFTYHWSMDSWMTEEWKTAKLAEIGPVKFASEYDIDYAAAVQGVVIRSDWVHAACGHRILWQDGEPWECEAGVPILAGFDIGPQSNTFVVRQGPLVREVEQWPGDTASAVGRAIELALRHHVSTVLYDAGGEGTKVRPILTGLSTKGIRWVGVNGAAPCPKDLRLEDGRRAADVFVNLRAYTWIWQLGERIRRTWEASQGSTVHEPISLITLPNDRQLHLELSVPVLVPHSSGRGLVESKDAARVRGVQSPHRGDALGLTFAPIPALVAPGYADTDFSTDELV